MVNTRSSQMGNKTIDPKHNTKPNALIAKPSSRKLKPLVEEKDYFMARVNTFSSFQVIDDIKKKLSPRQKELFAKTCFGQFLNLERFKLSGQLVHHFLLRQSVCTAMVFVIGGKKCEFGLKEFALITGLDCSEYVTLPGDVRDGKMSDRIRKKLFKGKERVLCKDIAEAFSCYKEKSDSDAVKLAQLYLLERVLLGKEPETACDDFSLGLVDNAGEFNKLPWGRFVYDTTAKYMRSAFERRENNLRKKSRRDDSSARYEIVYTLKGFPFALQCWACECIPQIGEAFGNRIGVNMPRMLNWSFVRRPNFKTLKRIFNSKKLQVESGLEPTEREIGAGYFRYFLGKQKLKKTKRTCIAEEDKSPIPWTQELVTMAKNCETAKCMNESEKCDHEAESIEYLKSEILALKEELKVRREEKHGPNCVSREEISAIVTEILTEKLCNFTQLGHNIVHIKDDEDHSGDKCTVQRKRKRSSLESEDDFPCFTIDVLECPDLGEKAEFDEWIKVGLKRNNRKKKYSDEDNTLHPAFDFTVLKCYKKDWFFSLNETAEWLSSTHIDVALYYIRKKKKVHPDMFRHRSTTTDCLFYAVLNSMYSKFKQDPENFLWSKESFICETLEGIEPLQSLPWVEVDLVYIPVNVNKKHWIVAVLDLKQRRLNVYDSYRTARNDKEVMSACLPMAEMLPWLMKSVGFFETRRDLKDVTVPLEVNLVRGIPQQENGGDCGMFMLKFTEFLMQDESLDACNQQAISFFRNKMAVELYVHGRKKMAKE